MNANVSRQYAPTARNIFSRSPLLEARELERVDKTWAQILAPPSSWTSAGSSATTGRGWKTSVHRSAVRGKLGSCVSGIFLLVISDRRVQDAVKTNMSSGVGIRVS